MVGRLSTAGIFRCGGPAGERWAWSIARDFWGKWGRRKEDGRLYQRGCVNYERDPNTSASLVCHWVIGNRGRMGIRNMCMEAGVLALNSYFESPWCISSTVY